MTILDTEYLESVKDQYQGTRIDEGDHDRFSHYVKKEALEKAIFEGTPAKALCGKVWLPTKDATRFPVCQQCKEIWESMEEY